MWAKLFFFHPSTIGDPIYWAPTISLDLGRTHRFFFKTIVPDIIKQKKLDPINQRPTNRFFFLFLFPFLFHHTTKLNPLFFFKLRERKQFTAGFLIDARLSSTEEMALLFPPVPFRSLVLLTSGEFFESVYIGPESYETRCLSGLLHVGSNRGFRG